MGQPHGESFKRRADARSHRPRLEREIFSSDLQHARGIKIQSQSFVQTQLRHFVFRLSRHARLRKTARRPGELGGIVGNDELSFFQLDNSFRHVRHDSQAARSRRVRRKHKRRARHRLYEKVDWIESSAFELLMFQSFHLYKSPRVVCRSLLTKYPDLAKATGFKVFPEFI